MENAFFMFLSRMKGITVFGGTNRESLMGKTHHAFEDF